MGFPNRLTSCLVRVDRRDGELDMISLTTSDNGFCCVLLSHGLLTTSMDGPLYSGFLRGRPRFLG